VEQGGPGFSADDFSGFNIGGMNGMGGNFGKGQRKKPQGASGFNSGSKPS
jgi:hypothetical protein